MPGITSIERALSGLWHTHSTLIIWGAVALIVLIVVALGFASYAIQDTQSRRKRIAEEKADIREQQIKKLSAVSSFADLEELGYHLIQCQRTGATNFLLVTTSEERIISLTRVSRIGESVVLNFEGQQDYLSLALILQNGGHRLEGSMQMHRKGQERISGTFICNDVQVRPLMNLGELKLTPEGLGECSLWLTKK